MSEEIGEAFVRIHADTTSFRTELDAQVKKALASAEKSLGKVGPKGTSTGSAASIKQAENATKAFTKDQIAKGKLIAQGIQDQIKAADTAAKKQIANNKKISSSFKKLAAGVNKSYADQAKAARAAADKAATASAKAAETAEKAQQRATAAAERAALTQTKAAERAAASAEAAANRAAAAQVRASEQAAAAAERAAAKEIAANERVAASARAAQGVVNDRTIRSQSQSFTSPRTLQDLKLRVDTADLSRAEAEAAGTALRIQNKFREAGKQAGQLLKTGILAGLAGVALTGAAGGSALAFIGIKQAAAIEQARFQFENLAPQIVKGDSALEKFAETAAGATKIGKQFSDQLIDISNKTTISFDALSKNVTALLATGESGQEAIGIVNDFANAAAAAGQSGSALDESVQGAVRAFTQIQGKGKLAAQELNQIADQIPSIQRVNIYKNIAEGIQATVKAGGGSDSLKKLAKNLGDVSNESGLTEKQLNLLRKQLESTEGVSSSIALPALQKAVQEVHGANDALDKQGKTLAGRLEAIKDTFRTTFGKAFLDNKAFQGFTDQLGKLVDDNGPNGIQGRFKEIANSLASSIGPALTAALPKILDALPGLAKGVGQIFSGIVAGAVAILPTVSKVFQAVGSIVEKLNSKKGGQFFKDLGTIIAPVIDSIKTFLAVLSPVIKVIVELVHQIAPLVALVSKITEPVNKLTRAFINLFNNDIIVKIAAFIASLLALEGVFAAVGRVVEGVAKIFPKLLETLKFSDILGGASKGLEDLASAGGKASGIFSKVADVLSKVKGVFDKLPGPIKFIVDKFTTFAVPGRFILKTIPLIERALLKLGESFTFVGGLFGRFASILAKIPVIGAPVAAVFVRIGSAISALGGFASAVVGVLELIVGVLGKIPGVGNAAAAAMDAVGNAVHKVTGFFGGLAHAVGIGGDKVRQIGQDAAEISGKFLHARNAVQGLVDELNAMPSQKNVDIVMRFHQIGAINTAFLNDLAVPLTGLEDATGFSTEGIMQAAKDAAKKEADAKKALVNSVGGGSGGAGGSGKSAAESAKNQFRDRIRTIIQGLDQDFKSGLIAGDVKNVKNTIKTLRRSIIDAFADADKPKPTKLLAQLQRENKRLQKLVAERDAIVKRLDDADAAFKSAFEGAESFADITDAFGSLSDSVDKTSASLSDLSRLRIIKPGQDALGALGLNKTAVSAAQATADQLDKVLRDRLAALTKFNNDIKAVIAKGLNRESVQQLINAGVSGGGATAAALAQASTSTITSINASQKAIDAQAKALGSIAGDAAASVGENVVLGIVKGLKTQKGALVDAITSLVDTIVKRLKKGLDIKSPSRVTAWIGRMIGKGLHGGMLDMHPAISDAAGKLAKAAIPQMKPISAPELARRADVEAMQQLRGAKSMSSNVSTVTHNKYDTRTVEAPVTAHFHGVTDPNSAAKLVAAHIDGIVKGGR